jgi:tRNA(Arg) A34 adenosine deaminase TadA
MTRSDDHSDSRETSEREFLTRAVRLAADNAAVGQLPFGALVVRDGEVIADDVVKGHSHQRSVTHPGCESHQ